MMEPQEEALLFFRKMVFAVYYEIGGLTPRIHRKLADKANITNSYFHGEKARQSAEIYQRTVQETDPEAIEAPYVLRTRLTLQDVAVAFHEGRWQNKFGGYNLGGPRWAKIADVTLQLRDAIQRQDWAAATELVYEAKKLRTNQGYLVGMFDWSERTH